MISLHDFQIPTYMHSIPQMIPQMMLEIGIALLHTGDNVVNVLVTKKRRRPTQ